MINLYHLNKYNKEFSDNGIAPHQTAAQERYLLDIIDIGSLNASNGIAKLTSTQQYSNWYKWYALLKHSGIADGLLGGIPQEQREILMSSFAA